MSLTQVTHDKKSHALEKFRQGCTWEEVAQSVGVTRKTLWNWAHNDEVFARGIAEAKADPDLEVEAVTFQNACDPDPAHNTLRMFWLKSRMPKRYKERYDVTSDDKPLNPTVFRRVDNPRDAAVQLRPPASTNGVCGEHG